MEGEGEEEMRALATSAGREKGKQVSSPGTRDGGFMVTGLAVEGPPCARGRGGAHRKCKSGTGSDIASGWGTAAGGEWGERKEGTECVL